MMISGTDIVFKDHGTVSALLNVAAIVWMEWEDAMFQDGRGTAYGYMSLPSEGIDELFIYRDQATLESWRDHGMTEANADSMICALIRDGDLTVIVGDAEKTETARLLSTMRKVFSALDAVN